MTYAGIGKIVALPDEVVAVNVNKKDKSKEGRSIASVEEKQVPQKSIAVKAVNGKTIIIENKKIRGKVFEKYLTLSRAFLIIAMVQNAKKART